MKWYKISVIGMAWALLPAICPGSGIIDFEDTATGAMFSGDMAGDTAGPLLVDGWPVTFLTTGVTPSGSLAADSLGLGINSGSGDPDLVSFNIGEGWEFNLDQKTYFEGIDFGGLQIEETITVQSVAWTSLASVNPISPSVTYDASSGSFTFTDNGAGNDTFDRLDMTGGRVLLVPAGTNVFIGGLTSTFGPNDDVEIQSVTLFAIPEPSSISLLLLAGLIWCFGTRKKTA